YDRDADRQFCLQGRGPPTAVIPSLVPRGPPTLPCSCKLLEDRITPPGRLMAGSWPRAEGSASSALGMHERQGRATSDDTPSWARKARRMATTGRCPFPGAMGPRY